MIYIIRHGQTDWNKLQKTQGQTDVPLNDVGRQEALSVAQQLAALPISKIISSDLKRAKETAEIINRSLGVPLLIDERLREMNFGLLEGIERHKLPDGIWDTFYHSPEKLKAESSKSVYKRIKSFFDTLDTRENILIVTHGGVLRMLAHYVNEPEKFVKEKHAQLVQQSFPNATLFQWQKGEKLTLFRQ